MRLPITILAILLLIPSVIATSFITIYVEENGEVAFFGETDEDLVLPLGISISNGEIMGKTNELTNKQGVTWEFSYELKNAEMEIVLPKGTVITKLENGEVYSNGQISVYGFESVKVGYEIREIDNNINYLLYGLLLIIVIIILIILFKKHNKKYISKDKIRKLDNVLNDREKLILKNLKETGKIKSSFLRKKCDIPKASFSRHLQELERKKLIKRTGEGKNKFVEVI